MFRFKDIKMSTEILLCYASERWGEKDDVKSKRNLVIARDLNAKATSYSILNKIAFVFSVLFTVVSLLFPFIEMFIKNAMPGELSSSSAFQTATTGLAAISIAIYNHYKKRQLYIENFMRHFLYLEKIEEKTIRKILKELQRVDAGFSFSVTEKDDEDNPENTSEPINPKNGSAN
ncbi:MAG: hypothetical protein ACTFAL_09925 [Candidatus Electronema sp. V4]|uniref:hypothetical protein n=1 Tax=Candidatus Electronema sp. V4 TaxID=3454756 RepID=UPI00405599FD